MVKIQTDVFWKAAIITVVVFALGVLLGYFLESSRFAEIEEGYKEIEIQWQDARLQTAYYQTMSQTSPSFCEIAINENLNFADRVYEEGLKLERYEGANKLTTKLLIDKKRYSLLKVQFWINSISLKRSCNATYKNLVYFYAHSPTLYQKSEQDMTSIILKELKEERGVELMLIPLPIDLDMATINMATKQYNITSVPTLLIDEEMKLEGTHSKEEIEKFLT